LTCMRSLNTNLLWLQGLSAFFTLLFFSHTALFNQVFINFDLYAES
jgi:hypothetical protein